MSVVQISAIGFMSISVAAMLVIAEHMSKQIMPKRANRENRRKAAKGG